MTAKTLTREQIASLAAHQEWAMWTRDVKDGPILHCPKHNVPLTHWIASSTRDRVAERAGELTPADPCGLECPYPYCNNRILPADHPLVETSSDPNLDVFHGMLGWEWNKALPVHRHAQCGCLETAPMWRCHGCGRVCKPCWSGGTDDEGNDFCAACMVPSHRAPLFRAVHMGSFPRNRLARAFVENPGFDLLFSVGDRDGDLVFMMDERVRIALDYVTQECVRAGHTWGMIGGRPLRCLRCGEIAPENIEI